MTVMVPIDPAQERLLDERIRPFGSVEFGTLDPLHYLNVVVLTDAHYDPLLVIECVVDGEPRHFWPALERCAGNELRGLLALAKMPDGAAPPRTPVDTLAWLDRFAVAPSASHQGHRGLSRARILYAQTLFGRAQAWLDTQKTPDSALELHRSLRSALDDPPALPPRLPWWERHMTGQLCRIAPLLAAPVALLALLGPIRLACSGVAGFALTGAIIAAIIAIIWRLRVLERTDPVQDAPRPDKALRRELRGNNETQNHLASIVHVKPGVLRALLIRVVLFGLRIKIRYCNTHGYLGSMRTIHFAHWTLIDNGARLLFLSNYDGSWDSYLDDFVEKADTGLTLGWGNCIGFPRTRWLICGGARHGREFKLWAMQSQRRTWFSYRAYPDLTVDRIDRHAVVAEGLGAALSGEKAAQAWAARL